MTLFRLYSARLHTDLSRAGGCGVPAQDSLPRAGCDSPYACVPADVHGSAWKRTSAGDSCLHGAPGWLRTPAECLRATGGGWSSAHLAGVDVPEHDGPLLRPRGGPRAVHKPRRHAVHGVPVAAEAPDDGAVPPLPIPHADDGVVLQRTLEDEPAVGAEP